MAKSSKTILCIDDDPTAVELRRLILLSKGYEVLIATQGDEALKIFAAMKVDLVISDHFMRSVTGGELASKMKAIHPDIPIILISGYPERPEGTERADIFVVKGGPTEELLAVVAEVLDKHDEKPVKLPPAAQIEGKGQEQSTKCPTKCPVCGNSSLQMHDLQTIGEHKDSQAISEAFSYQCKNGHVFISARHAR